MSKDYPSVTGFRFKTGILVEVVAGSVYSIPVMIPFSDPPVKTRLYHGDLLNGEVLNVYESQLSHLEGPAE